MTYEEIERTMEVPINIRVFKKQMTKIKKDRAITSPNLTAIIIKLLLFRPKGKFGADFEFSL